MEENKLKNEIAELKAKVFALEQAINTLTRINALQAIDAESYRLLVENKKAEFKLRL